MLKYFRFSVFVALALSVTYIVLMQQHFSAASDGSGPDGNALIAYFISIIAIVTLVHAAIVSVFIYGKNKTEAKKGFAILILGALLVGYPYLSSTASSAYQNYRYHASPYAKLMEAVKNKGTVNDILSKLNSVSEAEKGYVFFDDLIFQLCSANRIDVLNVFKEKNIAALNEENETTWAQCIYGSLVNENLKPSERLSLAKWVFEKPIVDNLFLKFMSQNMFDVNHFFESFKDLKDPEVTQLFDLLVQHGVDVNAGESLRPLWYATRFKYFEHVKFLIAHRADVNAVDSSAHTTALDEALNNKDQPAIDVLTAAGAKKAADLKN